MFWLGKSINLNDGETKIGVSPIEYIILAHLRRRELLNDGIPVGQYGNELIKELNEIFKGSWRAQSGTIYPMLSKLVSKKNFLTSEKQKTELGPRKKIYKLNQSGRTLIDSIVRENFKSDEFFIEKYLELLKPFKEKFENEELEEEPEENTVCSSCGYFFTGVEKFCPQCGNKLAETKE
jgi:DNA-binding PadR family transcriptional regulator